MSIFDTSSNTHILVETKIKLKLANDKINCLENEITFIKEQLLVKEKEINTLNNVIKDITSTSSAHSQTHSLNLIKTNQLLEHQLQTQKKDLAMLLKENRTLQQTLETQKKQFESQLESEKIVATNASTAFSTLIGNIESSCKDLNYNTRIMNAYFRCLESDNTSTKKIQILEAIYRSPRSLQATAAFDALINKSMLLLPLDWFSHTIKKTCPPGLTSLHYFTIVCVECAATDAFCRFMTAVDEFNNISGKSHLTKDQLFCKQTVIDQYLKATIMTIDENFLSVSHIIHNVILPTCIKGHADRNTQTSKQSTSVLPTFF